MVEREQGISLFHSLLKVGFLHADTRDWRRGVSTEKRLAKRYLAAVPHAKRQQRRNFVNHPLLHRAGATAILTGPRRISPVLG